MDIKILRVLLKTIVIPFYRINAGFFFFLFVVLVACMHPPELIFTPAFLHLIVESPGILTSYLLIVTLYARKSYLFLLRCTREKRNEFLFYLPLLNSLRFNLLIAITCTFFLLPVLLYSALIAVAGLKVNSWHIGVALFLYFAAVISFMVLLIRQKLVSRLDSYKMYTQIGQASAHLYIHFYINYILNEKKIFFLTTKISSILILLGALNIFIADGYPEQEIYFGLLISVILNNLLIYDIILFDQQYLRVIRNLPIRSTVYLVQSITWFLIIIPEVLLLVFKNPSFQVFIYAFFMLSICQCIGTSVYYSGKNMRKFLKLTLMLFIGMFVAILFRIPIVVLAVLCVSGSYILFRKGYFIWNSDHLARAT